jgi:lipopolysaccharide transport system permease protein
LLYFLTVREIKVRYKQTALGIAWAVLQPLFTMAIFTLFFGRLAKMPSDGIPYPVFALTALTPWTFFANGLTVSSNSLVTNANLITKVYFPRLAIPIAAVFSGAVDFLLSFALLIAYSGYRGFWPTWRILWLPGFVLLAVATSLGVGLWLSALNVEYRDVRYTVPFLTQIWLFATPIAYPSSLMHEPWRTVYGLNPMVGVVEGFRWAMLGSGHPPGAMFFVSCLAAALMLATGAFYFRRMEKGFADIV